MSVSKKDMGGGSQTLAVEHFSVINILFLRTYDALIHKESRNEVRLGFKLMMD